MNKVGIITIIDKDNYGNRLQNYALQYYLRKINFDVYTLKNNPFYNNRKNMLYNIFFYKMLQMYKLLVKKEYKYINKRRKNAFTDFDKKINYYKEKTTAYSKLSKFDYLIVGSDQVWNPKIRRLSDIELLQGIESKKRISYAASFGISEIDKKYKSRIKNELLKFKSISVREEQGKKIVEEITNRTDVEVLIDPTMLLTDSEWNNVIIKPLQINNIKHKKYILNYFLGELSKERKEEIERVAKENDCEIINILDKNSPFYECGPSEFLYLEKNAFLICTDSFHSCVFAIIYDRPFIVFDREQENIASMNSRLETLIAKFKLKDRKFFGKITKENLNHDYSEAYKILEKEIKKSEEFLKKALDIKK